MGRVKPTGRLGELAKIRAEGKREIFDPLPLMKEQAMRRATEPDPDRDPFVIHPSEMAKTDWCIRATYWRMSGRPQPDEKFNWVLENIFAKGNYTHLYFQGLLADTGELFGSWKCQVCGRWVHHTLSRDLDRTKWCAFFIDEDKKHRSLPHMWEYKEVRLKGGPNIAGKSDGGIRDTLLEFKTVGLGTLRAEASAILKKYYIQDHGIYDLDRLWKELKRPFPSHIKQGNIYLYLAREMGFTQFERMTYVYEYKPNQQTKKFQVTYSEDIMKPLLAKAELIVAALAKGEPPPCEFGGCEQCRAYEGNSGAAGSKNQSAEPDRPARRVVTRRSAGAGEAGPGGSPEPSGRRVTRAARGANRPARPRADVPVQPTQPVERPPGLSTERGPGRRTVRRAARGEADRSGTDPQ